MPHNSLYPYKNHCVTDNKIEHIKYNFIYSNKLYDTLLVELYMVIFYNRSDVFSTCGDSEYGVFLHYN